MNSTSVKAMEFLASTPTAQEGNNLMVKIVVIVSALIIVGLVLIQYWGMGHRSKTIEKANRRKENNLRTNKK